MSKFALILKPVIRYYPMIGHDELFAYKRYMSYLCALPLLAEKC